MTLIASFAYQEHPVLMGDLICSGINNEKDVRFPNVDSINEFFGFDPEKPSYTPRKLVQKVFIVNKNLMVAWTGSYIHARHLAQTLINDTFEDKLYDHETVMDLIRSEDPEILKEVQFLFFWNDGKGIGKSFSGTYVFESEKFGRVLVNGSGYDDLIKILKLYDKEPYFQDNLTSFQAALGVACIISSQLNANEINNSNNLYKYYGGGYEIATYTDEGFKKIPEISFINWLLSSDKKGNYFLKFSGVITKYFYANEFLIIVCTKLKWIEDEAKIEQQKFVVPPVYKPKPFEVEVKVKSLISSHYVCTNILSDQEDKIIAMNSLRVDKNDFLKIYSNNDKEININFDPDYIKHLKKMMSTIAGIEEFSLGF